MQKLTGTYLSAVRFSNKQQLRPYDDTYKRYIKPLSCVSFSNKQKINRHLFSTVKFGWPVRRRFPRAYSTVSFSNSSLAIQTYYQGTIKYKRASITPSASERRCSPECIGYIQLPDANTAIKIPYFIGGKISRAINAGISWDMHINNISGEFSCLSEDWKDLLEPGFYSEKYDSRKFICLIFVRKTTDRVDYLIVPRLVLRDQAGETILERGGIDEITFLLGQGKTFNSYVPTETLTRISARVYESLYLTKNEKTNLTEVRVDGVLKSALLNTSTRQWSFNYDIDSHSIVQVINPLDAAWIIDDICKKVVDSQASKIRKEYFQTTHKFPAFRIENTIQCQGQPMINIIKYILQARGAEFVIKPRITSTFPTIDEIAHEKLTLETSQIPLPSELAEFGKYAIPETFMNRRLQMPSSGVNKRNVIKVKSPAKVLNVQVKQTSTIYSEVQKEVDAEPVPNTIPAGSGIVGWNSMYNPPRTWLEGISAIPILR